MNLIKKLYDFSAENVMNLALSIFIMLILCFLFRQILTYCTKKEFESGTLSNVLLSALFSILLSCLIFLVSTFWVEYPLGGYNIWTKDSNGKWKSSSERIVHDFARFKGYNIYKNGITGAVSLSENSPFTLKYHVTNANMPILLNHLKLPESNCGCGESSIDKQCDELIRKKSYKLFYVQPMSALADDENRNRIFKEYYEPYGITVDSVDFP
ncbi:hypothetical protein H7X65_00250 [Candidatus Parcubacteria bacterium]|nr:hypothetical protein [Candidatus Parcubacteria bacterium]